MIYITGDCHANWTRFSTANFPEQAEMTRDDFIIICGDFGIWHNTETERWWLKWFTEKPFTVLFVDGNHENFDRLYNDFEVVDFHGGKAHRICENVYHLIRGHIFDLCGKKFFAFGGARSHDIKHGILEPKDFESRQALHKEYMRRTQQGAQLRINHTSWWKEEMPSKEEMEFGLQTLKKHKNKVDYIISHCAPQQVASIMSFSDYKPDELTGYFDNIALNIDFKEWFFGHYHQDRRIIGKYTCLYNDIIRIT